MPPAEDAQLLLRLVQRHLLAMELNLSPRYPEEEWGFQAQQALEKLLKTTIVLSNSQAPGSHVGVGNTISRAHRLWIDPMPLHSL